MNKKAAELSLTVIIVAILASLALILASYVMIPRESNPDEEVCMKEICYIGFFDSFKKDYLIKKNFSCNELKKQLDERQRNQLYFFEECGEWRPKNICDTEPNNEACVCDEYKEVNIPVIIEKSFLVSCSNEDGTIDYTIDVKKDCQDCIAPLPDALGFDGNWNCDYEGVGRHLRYDIQKTCTKAHLRGEND